MSCEQTRHQLDHYVRDGLEPVEAAEVREHLEVCPACEDEARFAQSLLGAYRDHEDLEAPSEGFANRVMASLPIGEASVHASGTSRPILSLQRLSRVAALLLLCPLAYVVGDRLGEEFHAPSTPSSTVSSSMVATTTLDSPETGSLEMASVDGPRPSLLDRQPLAEKSLPGVFLKTADEETGSVMTWISFFETPSPSESKPSFVASSAQSEDVRPFEGLQDLLARTEIEDVDHESPAEGEPFPISGVAYLVDTEPLVAMAP